MKQFRNSLFVLLALLLLAIPASAGNLTVTAGSVLKQVGASTKSIAGATITAGQAVYFDTSTGTWKLAQADGTAAEAGSGGLGISLNGASSGQPLEVQTSGTINPGATVVVGEIYVLSDTAGSIAIEGDNATTDYVSVLGIGTTSAQILLAPIYAGVQVP